MPLITGRHCDLKIADTSYKAITSKFELKFDESTTEYETLAGKLSGDGSESGTLTIAFAYDSGETDSLYDALWDAREGNDLIEYEAKVGKATFTGYALARRPGANATPGASEVSVDLPLDGMPTKSTVAL